MTKRIVAGALLLLGICLRCGILQAQAPAGAPTAKADFSQEPYVVEKTATKLTFANDGTGVREQTTSVRVQSDAGVQKWGLLVIPYESATQTVEIDYVRVEKPDGKTVATPEDNVQDLDSGVTQAAPMYSDLREKHVAVKSLSVGDTVEYRILWRTTKPLAPGQFWFAYDFEHDAIVLDQRLEIDIPPNRPLKVRGGNGKVAISIDSGARSYRWNEPNLAHKAKNKNTALAIDAALGHLPEPDVMISSFQSWEEVGRWYWDLQKDRTEPSADIRAKATELTQGLTDPMAKVNAIYNFVSQKYRYIGIDFGIGRYQPHSADDILSNNFGDCKDKHTLMASLLEAVGITAYPALINVRRRIDPEVPTPAQFDHVITYVPLGKDAVWLDSTAEVAPPGFLVSPLRGKQALVISNENTAQLIATPESFGPPDVKKFEVNAKIGEDGVLDAKMDFTVHNDDSELLLRSTFRQVGSPQWEQLAQGLSVGLGFGGTVSDVHASSPENTAEPFHLSYSYHRKDYSDWSHHQISMPGLPFYMPSDQDDDLDSNGQVFLGPNLETESDATVQLPQGYSAQIPASVDIVRDYAEYHATYAKAPDSVSVRRRMLVKLPEVPKAEQEDYGRFQKAVREDIDSYIEVSSTPPALANLLRPTRIFRDNAATLPGSTNGDATKFETDAMGSIGTNDTEAAITSMKKAVAADPRFTRAWLRLGGMQALVHQTDSSLSSYRKAIESDPTQPICYKALAFYLMSLDRGDDAIPVWQQLLKVAPDERDTPAILGTLYLEKKRYNEAIPQLQAAERLNPDAILPTAKLAEAYLLSGDLDKGHAEVAKARQFSQPELPLNDISYDLAEANQDLPDALDYVHDAVKIEEDASTKIRLDDLGLRDLRRPAELASYWDTLGWVEFRLGHLDKAEEYLHAAWMDSQYGIIGDHLAQVYDHENKKQDAILTYRLALTTLERQTSNKRQGEIRKRLAELAPGASTGLILPAGPDGVAPSDKLIRWRTTKLPRIVTGPANAEFFLVVGPGPKVEELKFVDGSDELRLADKLLNSANLQVEFPKGSTARIVRRGLLDCHPYSGCEFLLLPIDSVTSVN